MGWLVNAKPRQVYSREISDTHYIGGLVGPRVGLDEYGKSRPTGLGYPDHPAHSESLYRLSYRGTHTCCGSTPKGCVNLSNASSKFVDFQNEKNSLDMFLSRLRAVHFIPAAYCSKTEG